MAQEIVHAWSKQDACQCSAAPALAAAMRPWLAQAAPAGASAGVPLAVRHAAVTNRVGQKLTLSDHPASKGPASCCVQPGR
jgi:negative regulator of sigma E activity